MSLLPAVVPDIPEERAELVPARVARKVAPLFGVVWPGSPFGPRTWVSDFGRITLSEIARGAPLPTRTQGRALNPRTDGRWQIIDRVAVAPGSVALPNEIANATLNRFGPDTKAAVVLTAVNRLLAPVTDAVLDALPLVVGPPDAPLPVELRLAAWAGIVIEVFRSQPALVAAGIRARTIQRELTVSWHLPLADRIAGLPLTRCEIDPSTPDPAGPDPDRPRDLEVADRTFEHLRLLSTTGEADPDADADPVSAERDADDHTAPGVADRLLRDETVDALLRRLLVVGTPDDAAHLWLSERAAGQLTVEALLPPTAIVDQFVRQAVRSLDAGAVVGPCRTLPRVPEPDDLAGRTPLARRAVVIGLLTVLRHIQHDPADLEATRDPMVPLLRRLGALARHCFADDDALGVLARCRVADMLVQTLRHDSRNDLRAPLDDLHRELRAVQNLFRAGVLDRGAAAEAISSANVELNIVRWTNAADPAAGLPRPALLQEELQRSWRIYHEAMEIETPAAEQAAGHHLHNYAAFLASSPLDGPRGPEDVGEAVRLFRDVVIPARRAFARTGAFLPLRHSLQVASRATTRLAEWARDRGDLDTAREHAATGLGWIRLALADPGTAATITAGAPTEKSVRLALLAAPALLVAVELDAGGTPADVTAARELVGLVQAWEQPDLGAHHARHQEIVALAARLAALDTQPAPA